MKNLGAFSILTTVLLAAPGVFAYEVDNFTGRSAPTPESRILLNAETNRLLDAAVLAANSAGPCSDPMSYTGATMPPIYAFVRNHLDGNPVATIEQWANGSLPAANRPMPDLDHSIYGGMSFADGFVLRTARLEPSIRLNGYFVGVDKLGHFMAQGYEYFEHVWASGRVRDALSYGRGLEDGMYGMETTGVRSFGDMAANFGGMTFYRDLLYGPSPILSCVGGRYSRVRAFDWANYVNSAWDEAINCSEFGPGLAVTVSRNLTARGTSCPVAVPDCEGLAALPCSAHYVSAACQSRWVTSEPGGVCNPALSGLPARSAPAPVPAGTGVVCPTGASAPPTEPGLIERTADAISRWWNS